MNGGEILCAAIEKSIYGRPAAKAIAEEAARLGAKRVFLLVSSSLLSGTDEINKVQSSLRSRFVGIYDGIPPHATRSSVLEAAEEAKNVAADLIVTIGGGTLTDAGKIMQICIKHDLQEHDDLEPYRVRVGTDGTVVRPEFEAPDLRMIAVPTTLSGGEFSPSGGVTDEKRRIKQAFQHRSLVPISVIMDPGLTVHTPEWLWHSTGVRSLDHAVETLGSLHSNDFCDGIAESAIRLLVDGLSRVKSDPSDLEGRLRCQLGVWQSMIPLVSGVPMGASHAIGHTLGGTFDVPHGYTSCVMSPFVLRFNQENNAERQKNISRAFGAPERPAHELADDFIRGLGMPRSLGEVGITEEHLKVIAEYTMEDAWTRTNPRQISQPTDVMEILRTAL